jgi:hypothetical protein
MFKEGDVVGFECRGEDCVGTITDVYTFNGSEHAQIRLSPYCAKLVDMTHVVRETNRLKKY